MKLVSRQPKRVFTFGCSFTEYHWTTWAQVVAYDLGVPLYNYGKTGGGNFFITNMLVQANLVHQFNEDDLVIICWTNTCREDRWINNKWVTPGNIFTQKTYPQSWVEEFVDPTGRLLLDLGQIDLCKNLLQGIGCQWHFLSMIDIIDQPNQDIKNDSESKSKKVGLLGNKRKFFSRSKSKYTAKEINENRYKSLIKNMFSDTIDNIQPGFFEVLWDNNIHINKFVYDNEKFNNKFSDGHPFPIEHYKYLTIIFDEHQFKPETLKSVEHAQQRFETIIKEKTKDIDDHMYIFQFNTETMEFIISETTITKNNKTNLI